MRQSAQIRSGRHCALTLMEHMRTFWQMKGESAFRRHIRQPRINDWWLSKIVTIRPTYSVSTRMYYPLYRYCHFGVGVSKPENCTLLVCNCKRALSLLS